MKTQSTNQSRKKISLLLLPIPITMCLTTLFWSLGGGSSNTALAQAVPSDALNAALPVAYFDEKDTWDKFKLYEQASYDSAKYEEARESDPYFDLATFKTQQRDTTPSSKGMLVGEFKKKDPFAVDANEEKVNRKIEELYQQINQPAKSTQVLPRKVDTLSTTEFSSDVDRLERMMDNLHTDRQADPEMQQIESMLEKILDIQHPERVKQKLQSTLPTENVSQVVLANQATAGATIQNDHNIVSTAIDNTSTLTANGFFGLEDNLSTGQVEENIIQAVIHDEQELVTGATIKLRLIDQVVIDGHTLDRDSFIYGTCSINGERLTIEISSIHFRNTLLKVSLKAYDLDGIEGIYVPGAIARDVAKQSSGNAMQGVQFMSMNTSLGAQAAAAGVEAAKGLFSKKAKLIKVTVKAGYQVLLKNGSNNTSF
jgi:conjugative transposon TraM protein